MTALCISLLFGIPLLDLSVKYGIERRVKKGEEIPILHEKAVIRHVHNEGMALNLLERKPRVVRGISVAVVIPAVLRYMAIMCKRGRRLEKISLSMALGGAASNLYDRFVRRYVVDYVGFKSKWKALADLTFNIADFFIMAGALGLSLSAIFQKRK